MLFCKTAAAVAAALQINQTTTAPDVTASPTTMPVTPTMLPSLSPTSAPPSFPLLQTTPSQADPSLDGLATEIKIMSFNLRTTLANDPCPSGCWEQRKERAKQLLDKYQPDFIGSQEGAPDQITYFTQTLGYQSFGECAGPCGWNERNSIFYMSDVWKLLEGNTFALSDTPEQVPSNTWNLQYLRAAVLARFEHKQSGNIVCMLNTHYDINNGQEQSSILITKRMATFCKSTDTVVMTGDLNAPPQTAAIKYLTNDIQLTGQNTPVPMYEALTAAGVSGPTWIGGSFGDQVTGNKIDYIFARDDSQTCLRSGAVLVDKFNGYTSSDHAVVMSAFCIGFGCTGCLTTP